MMQAGAPIVIAHRGDSFRAPENTIEAARVAFEGGADAWELDVQLTRDGVPVVIHDASLLRTTDVADRFAGDPRVHTQYLVSDFTIDEIRLLDAGSWFVRHDGGYRSAAFFGTLERLGDATRERLASAQIRIPTLDEALARTVEWDWMVNVEIKGYPVVAPGLTAKVIEAVRKADVVDRVLISSFDHDAVAEAIQICPEVAAGVLTTNAIHRPEAYVRDVIGALAYHPAVDLLVRHPEGRIARGDLLHRLRDAGVPVNVYTVNDVTAGGLADRLFEAGVTSLYTDDSTPLAARLGRHQVVEQALPPSRGFA